MTDKPNKQFDIRFLPDDITAKASAGESVLKTALKAGVHINTTCGGSGTCGACRIRIKDGRLDCRHTNALSQDELNQGIRLACQSQITGNVTVEVIRSVTNPERITAAAHQKFTQLPSGSSPFVSKLALKLPAPTLADNSADFKRLKYGLKNKGYEKTDIIYHALKNLPEIMRSKDWEITATLARSFPVPLILKLESGDTAGSNYGIAFDVGTTAVRGRLIDLNNGEKLAEKTNYNKQRAYGEDVISRITYCRKTGGVKTLQSSIIDTLNKLITDMSLSASINREDINSIVIAANTVMVELLLGINPEPLRLSPYVPAIDSIPPVTAAELGIELGKHCFIHILPVVASYVGGDIVAGVTACSIHKQEEISLYIDIGTNGEIVLGRQDWMVTAACSAGPTFEGGGIKHGMLAIEGAIEGFELPDPCGEPLLKVIGNRLPAGICGSGLINTASALFTAGILEQNGKFNPSSTTSRLRQGEDGLEYVLVEGKSASGGQDIVLTEIDVDNFIRSKAAIYSGCQTLAESVGIDLDKIDNIIIAGTFGSHIDITNAVKVGLLPDVAKEKFRFIGNGSLEGASLAALSLEAYQDTLKIAELMTSIELSESRLFMDNYVASLFLPHTDLSRFPSVVI